MSHPELHPCVRLSAADPSAARAGVWLLAAGQAVGLQARRTRELRVVQGRVWVTTGPGQVAWLQGAGWPVSGDTVMRAGEVLQVPADTRVVVESWPEAGGLPTRFEWVVPAPTPAEAAARPVWDGLVRWGRQWVRGWAVRPLKSAPSPGVLPHMGCGG